MTDLRASVVIPTFNRRAILAQTLKTLETQTVSPDRLEVIIGIDGSTDGTAEALDDLAPPYTLRWVSQANAGPAAASNRAARLANGEVLVFLDDDQLASPGLIAAHLDVHERLGDVLVQGLYPLAPGYDRRGASLMYERWLLGTLAPIDRQHPSTPHIWSANISLRRSTWAAVGGLDESFREYGGEDTDFGVRVAALGVPVIFEPKALSYHLHDVSYRQVRNQAYSQGRSLVRLARKHRVSIETFSGGELNRRVDRAVAASWRRAPRLMQMLGKPLTLPLWVADLARVRPAQLALARLVHRYYKVGGIAVEQQQEVREHATSAP
jgi:GT2 family glycosyltransferase